MTRPRQWEFSLLLRGHIQRGYGTGFSSAPARCSRPSRLLVLFTVVVYLTGKVHNAQATKKPLLLRGYGNAAHFPSSCGTQSNVFRRNWHPSRDSADGLPGFIGPCPSTSLDESRNLISCTCSVVYVHRFRFVSNKYTRQPAEMSRAILLTSIHIRLGRARRPALFLARSLKVRQSGQSRDHPLRYMDLLQRR